jgi:hypothetical protein
MANFRQQLFQQFASQGIALSLENFQEKYQPKKENRFNVDGITYEASPAKISADGIEFEISSKIPQEELLNRDDFESYFTEIKAVIECDDHVPEAIDMENIVHDVGGEDAKERDYVRLRYQYNLDQVCGKDVVEAELAKLQQDPTARTLPQIPNVNTMAGKVVLLCIEDFFRHEAAARMESLIEANQAVRKKMQLSKHTSTQQS